MNILHRVWSSLAVVMASLKKQLRETDGMESGRIWTEFRIAVLILCLTFIVLLTVIYLGLLYYLSGSFPTTIAEYFTGILSNLITSLIAVAVSLWLFHNFQEHQETDKRNLLINKVTEAVSKGQSIESMGLVKIWKNFPTDKLEELLSKAKDVRVLTTWLQEPLKDHELWAKVVKANQGTVKILMLKEESRICEYRSESFPKTKGKEYVSKNVRSSLSDLQDICDSIALEFGKNDQFVVKVYDALPSLHLIICNDTAFVGFYWFGVRATKLPVFEFTRLPDNPTDPDAVSFFTRLEQEFARFDKIATSPSYGQTLTQKANKESNDA